MLNFYRISSVSDPLFSKLYNLYVLAFPQDERRNWGGFEFELGYEKHFCAHALVQDDKFVGLFNYWTFDRFYYIEHVAVSSAMRGQNIGTQAMETFKQQTKLPIILEVEMPNSPTAIRRINFYEKLGFTVLNSHNYAQPPYEGDGFLIPMQLMSNDTHFADTHFELIKETLYDKVYHYEVEKERTTNS
ncbi:MAG TPA: GNAT family N-acetyltransferase [Paludibacter sp.]|nr:GNAT family N-acetyltransferase [Paludibacter sp.]